MQKEISSVFQADSKNIGEVYTKADNYLVEYDEMQLKKYCVLYFSSNNIYFPNTAEVFENSIIKKNKFEWYGTRINKAYKHIFLRDIKKQWYLTGINESVSNPDALLNFLRKETKGYKVITVGSSAGGFAAVLYGQLLKAELIYTFNGQFEINSLLKVSSEKTDPILFREQTNSYLRDYYDLRSFIKEPRSIHYFCSKNSTWDNEQYIHISKLPINTYHFKTNHHGIPFIKSILPVLLNAPITTLESYLGKKINPITFSVFVGGLDLTIKGLWHITNSYVRKKINF